MKPVIRKKVKKGTPTTRGRKGDDRAFTTYDTTKPETEDPQKVREAAEASAEFQRTKKS